MSRMSRMSRLQCSIKAPARLALWVARWPAAEVGDGVGLAAGRVHGRLTARLAPLAQMHLIDP